MKSLQEIIARMEDTAVNPRKIQQEYLATGGKVVLCGPPIAPYVLVHAAGILPMAAWGASNTKVSDAYSYFPPYYCSIIVTIMERGLNNGYSGCEAIILPTLCDALKNLQQNFYEGVTRKVGIEMLDLAYPHHRKTEHGKQFLRTEFIRIKEAMERISGNVITDEKLWNSIKLYNEHSKLMREFSALAPDHSDIITPLVRHRIFKSALFMLCEEHKQLMEDLIAQLKAQPKVPAHGLKAVMTGIFADSDDVLKIMEEENIQVVGDDLLQESKNFEFDIPTNTSDALDALCEQYGNYDGACILYDPKTIRREMIQEIVKERSADCVIINMPKFCEFEAFDYPMLANALTAAKIPYLQVENDINMPNVEHVRTQLQAFKESCAVPV